MADFDRPQHPDFKVLAAAVRANDAKAEGGQDMEKIIAEVADPDSVMYVGFQRAIRMEKLGASVPRTDSLASMWADGLLAGYALAVRHAREPYMHDGSRRTGG